jgi:uracil-DNA glycosylase family protein
MPTKSQEYARPATPPESSSLTEVREASLGCTACHLYRRATQTVFGEGPKHARIILVGEQPGDYEDVAGKPFVGPAGKIMDQALEEAGIDRRQVYVTNAVKHFKWEPRGKRRIHRKPNSREIAACRPWLEAELRIVRPKLLLCLGATAAQAIFGPAFRVTRERGKLLSSELAPKTMATVHPSSLLRQPDEESRHREYKKFVADLRAAGKAAEGKVNKGRHHIRKNRAVRPRRERISPDANPKERGKICLSNPGV